MSLTRITSVVERRPLGHVRLWIDDLDAMVRLVRQVTPDIDMCVDGDYRIDEVGDLAQYPPPKIKSFELTTKDSVVSLELSRRESLLTLNNPSLAVQGMATEFERLAKRCRRQIYSRRNLLISVAFIIAVATWGWTYFVSYRQAELAIETDMRSFYGFTEVGSFIVAALAGTIGLIRYGTFSRGSAIVIARSRKDAPTWLRRNKDALLTNAIVSAVFLVIGIIVGYLLPKG